VNEVGTIHDIVRTLVVAAIITLIVILVLTIISPNVHGSTIGNNTLTTGEVIKVVAKPYMVQSIHVVIYYIGNTRFIILINI